MFEKVLEQTTFQSLVNDFLFERQSRNRSKNNSRYFSQEEEGLKQAIALLTLLQKG
jgi:hypothetical protein